MKIINLLQRGIPGGRRGWTVPFLILVSSCITDFLQAQAPPPEPPAPPSQSAPPQLSPEELDTLLAPIALYPDALIALILPASTLPSDVVVAARYIASNGDPAQVANQPWDDSVKSLVRYPDVLSWMDQNLEWTTALGEAFVDQPADVMNSIQRLRAEAIAAGNLTDSPQQQVVQEETVIRIVPAQPDVIYVPQYDPDVVYVQPYSQDFGPVLTFGAGFAVGSWLNYDCDWDRRSIYVGHWRPGWNNGRNWDRGDRNWDRGDNGRNWDRGDNGRNWDRGDRGRNNNIVNVVNIDSDTAREWQPSANSQRRQARSNRANERFANVDAADANDQPGGPGLRRSAEPRANRVPKPARPNFTSQGNERIRRDSQISNGSNTSPPAPNDAAPGARGKNRKAAEPTVAPNVPGEQGTTEEGRDKDNAPRNLRKQAQGSDQNVAPSASGTPAARGKNRKVAEPTIAPNVPGEQGTTVEGRGKDNAPRNLRKQAQGSDQNVVPGASGTPAARGKNRKATEPTVAPNVSGEQGTTVEGRGQDSAPRNLRKQGQGSSHSKGAVNNQPTASPSTGASTQKHQKRVDPSQSSTSKSDNAPHPSNRQKLQQKQAPQSAPSLEKKEKPSQPPPAAAQRDQRSQRSAAAVQQNTAPQPSNASRGKGKGKGGGEKKTDENKNKGDN